MAKKNGRRRRRARNHAVRYLDRAQWNKMRQGKKAKGEPFYQKSHPTRKSDVKIILVPDKKLRQLLEKLSALQKLAKSLV